jgi:hypothetical protein
MFALAEILVLDVLISGFVWFLASSAARAKSNTPR